VVDSAIAFLEGAATWFLSVTIASVAFLGGCWGLFRCWTTATATFQTWAWRLALLATVAVPTVGGLFTQKPPRADAEPTPMATPYAAAPGLLPTELLPTEQAVDAVVLPEPLALPRAAAPWWGAKWCGLAGLVLVAAGWARWGLLRRRLRVALAEGDDAPAAVVGVVHALARRAGRAAPSVRIVPALSSPAVWGLGRGCLGLPSAASAAEPRDLEGMLAHELAHLCHRDPLHGAVVQVVRTCLWWNPLVHVATDRLDRAVELRADATAGIWVGRRTVARGLVRAAEWVRASSRSDPTVAAGVAHGVWAMAGARGLGQRVEALLRPPIRVSRRRSLAGSGALCSAACAIVFALPCPAWASPETDDATSLPAGTGVTGLTGVGAPFAAEARDWLDVRASLELIRQERAQLAAEVAGLDDLLVGDPGGAADRALLRSVAARLAQIELQERVVAELLEAVARGRDTAGPSGPRSHNVTRNE